MLKTFVLQNSVNIARFTGSNFTGGGFLSTCKYDLNKVLCRTTYILSRRTPVRQLRNNMDPNKYNPRKKRNKVYDVEVVSELTEDKEIAVILNSFVPGLGEAGDVMRVPRKFAYGNLLLPQLARYASPKEIEQAEEDMKNRTSEDTESHHSSPFVVRTMQYLQQKTFNVVMNLENEWVLQPWHVRVAFRKAGVHLSTDDCVIMPKEEIRGPNMDLEEKEFFVTVKINNKETTKVRLRIHHWSTEIANRLPPVPFHWTMAAEPLYSEEAEELKTLPLLPRPKPKIV